MISQRRRYSLPLRVPLYLWMQTAQMTDLGKLSQEINPQAVPVCWSFGGFCAFCYMVKEADRLFGELPRLKKALTFHSVLIDELMEYCHLER